MTITVQTFAKEFRHNLKISELELEECILNRLMEDYENRNLTGLTEDQIPEYLVETMSDGEHNEYSRIALSYVVENEKRIIKSLAYRIKNNVRT